MVLIYTVREIGSVSSHVTLECVRRREVCRANDEDSNVTK